MLLALLRIGHRTRVDLVQKRPCTVDGQPISHSPVPRRAPLACVADLHTRENVTPSHPWWRETRPQRQGWWKGSTATATRIRPACHSTARRLGHVPSAPTRRRPIAPNLIVRAINEGSMGDLLSEQTSRRVGEARGCSASYRSQ